MTALNQRHQILESLESLDQAQAQQVLDYIKGLKSTPSESAQQKMKREAMIQIRQALKKGRTLNPAF